jgi:hypothetical protein
MTRNPDETDPFQTVQAAAKASHHAEVPDVIPPTMVESLLIALKTHIGSLLPGQAPTGADIRKACRFCYGRGCLHCDAIAQQEYERQFPKDKPAAPLITFRRDDPEDLDLMRRTISAQALGTLPHDPDQAYQQLLDTLRQAADEQQRLADAPREEV